MIFEQGPHIPVTSTAHGARTIGEMFLRRTARSASRNALYHRPLERWEAIPWSGFEESARKVARGLVALGLTPGDRVAVLGPTQPPWAIYDFGAQLAGMVSFGIYPKQSKDQVRYLLEHSDAKVIFVDEPGELETVLAASEGLRSIQAIVPWTASLHAAFAPKAALVGQNLVHPSAFAGEPLSRSEIESIQAKRRPEDTAILVYTSGTTGPPKGAMVSHENILSVLASSGEELQFTQADLALHFLPMAHAAERVLGFYGRISSGVPGAYAKSVGTVLEDLKSVRPTLFGSVPRIFEKAHAKIFSEVEKQSPAVRRLFSWATEVGHRRLPYVIEGKPIPHALSVQYALADRLVFRRIRDAFGGRMRLMITGAAPTAPAILDFFWSAGLPIYEAYGMTESTVITHINRPGKVRLGTVGQVIEPMICRIAADGEILVKGPFVFGGYYKNEEATRETVQDGWLHTGDIGTIDGDGYLKITDRKKHLIITAGGKNLSPSNIEKAIKESDPIISQVHAHGDRRAYVVAIVAPSPLETLEWGLDRGLSTREEIKARTLELMENPAGRSAALNAAMAKVVVHPDFRARLQKAVRAGNQKLSQVEQVRRFVILDRDFSQEAGELTPTMKVKRKEVETAYAALLDRMYTEDGFALEP
jgi:long-chain acyl-CoA synthetase